MSSDLNSTFSSENTSVTQSRIRSQRLQSSETKPAEDSNIVPSGKNPSLPVQSSKLIPLIRSASRLLVREMGFMSPTLANTSLSASSVHALLEINTAPKTTATSLAQTLNLEKSSISRLLSKLSQVGYIQEETSEGDKREKHLSLTEKGMDMAESINSWADKQVGTALAKLPDPATDPKTVLEGIEKYANAFKAIRHGTPLSHPLSQEQNHQVPSPQVEIKRGYLPGILARCLEMHMSYYYATAGFGALFEAQLSTGLGELLAKLPNTQGAEVWSATLGGKIVGTVWMDGTSSHRSADQGYTSSSSPSPDIPRAHLRAFIVDESVRGKGVGRQLINSAMKWTDDKGYLEVELWTFKGLDAARRLYDEAGFGLREEMMGSRWGEEKVVQHFVRVRKG